jgi:peptidyl-prolyl cis-trans isomerase B (cyclophilin B)
VANQRRSRELARKKTERQATRRQRTTAQRRRTQQIVAIGVVALLVFGALGYVFVQSDSAGESGAAPESAAAGCAEPAPLRAENIQFDAAPPIQDRGPNPLLTLETNCGEIVIETLPSAAPRTVNSALFLADEGFLSGTQCHRLTTAGIFVLQCGDPTGTGTGGPGYQIPDENLPTEGAMNYPAGTVAMANAGPGTSGSQFFIVYDDTTLPPAYTIWGTVVQGLDVVRALAAQGTSDGGPDGAPAQPIVIESAYVDGR